jgi:hypothetical protein
MNPKRTGGALALVVTVLLIAACAATPTNRWAQARDTLSTAQDSVLIAHEAGLIDDETLVQADPVAKACRAALDRAAEDLPEGGDSFESYMAIVGAMLDRLEEMARLGQLGGD